MIDEKLTTLNLFNKLGLTPLPTFPNGVSFVSVTEFDLGIIFKSVAELKLFEFFKTGILDLLGRLWDKEWGICGRGIFEGDVKLFLVSFSEVFKPSSSSEDSSSDVSGLTLFTFSAVCLSIS